MNQQDQTHASAAFSPAELKIKKCSLLVGLAVAGMGWCGLAGAQTTLCTLTTDSDPDTVLDPFIERDAEGNKVKVAINRTEDNTVGIDAKLPWFLYDRLEVKLLGRDSIALQTTKILGEDGDSDSFISFADDVSLLASTAIKGNADVYFMGSSTNINGAIEMPGADLYLYGKRTDIDGNIEMSEGNLYNLSTTQYAGTANIQKLVLADDNPDDGSAPIFDVGSDTANAVVRAQTVNLSAGTIHVHGREQTNGQYASGSILMTKHLTAQEEETLGAEVMPGAKIQVTGNGALVLGTLMDRPMAFIDKDFPGFGDLNDEQKSRARLVSVMRQAVTASDRNPTLNGKSTLVIAGDYTQAVPERVSITVGDVNEPIAGDIRVGGNGQVVLYWDDEMKSGAVTAGLSAREAGTLSLTGEGEAALVLFGWDGLAPIHVSLDGFDSRNVFSVAGVRAAYDPESRTIARVWCHNFAGLKSRDIVRYVEESNDYTAKRLLPGYSFLIDSFEEMTLGRDFYANAVDAAVFLPAVDGTAAVFERAQSDIVDTILDRDFSLFEGKTHWWASGRYENREIPELISGGNGPWGYDVDTTAGILGVDFALGKNWVGGIAAHAGAIDTESRGEVTRTTADASFGGITLSAAWGHADYGQVRLALSYARSEGDSKQLITGHYFTTESTSEILTAAVRWHKDYSYETVTLRPIVRLGVNAARMKDADIVDRTEIVVGTGFKTTADDRLWFDANIGGQAKGSWKFDSYQVEPRLGAAFGWAFGDTDWAIESRLFDDAASSRASFESARKRSATLSAAVDIASSGHVEELKGGIFGFGAKPTGKELPFSWTVSLQAQMEYGSDSEKASSVSLSYRALY